MQNKSIFNNCYSASNLALEKVLNYQKSFVIEGYSWFFKMSSLSLCLITDQTEQDYCHHSGSVQVSSMWTLSGSHFQQLLLFNLKQTPALGGREIRCSSALVELNRLGVAFCYQEVHSAAASLHCCLWKELKKGTKHKTQGHMKHWTQLSWICHRRSFIYK